MFKIITSSKWKEFTESFGNLQDRYDKTCMELTACVKWNAQYKKANDDLVEENKKLLERLEALESDREDRIINSNIIKQENEELKIITRNWKELQGDLAEFRSHTYQLVESSNPVLLKEFYDMMTEAQRTIVFGSLRSRDVNGIAYRDGANDGINILKGKLKEYMNRAMANVQKAKVKSDL